MASAEVLTLTLLAGAEARNFVKSSVDTTTTVHSTVDTTDLSTQALRRGELVGAGLAVGFGAACSLLSRSWLPVAAAVVVTMATVAQHEAELMRALAPPPGTPEADIIPLPSGGGTPMYRPLHQGTMTDT